MASTHIQISATTRQSADVRRFVDLLQQTQDLARKLKESHAAIAAGDDYTALATVLGLPEVGGDGGTNAEPDTATAQAVKDMIGSAADVLLTNGHILGVLARMT